MFPTGKRRWTQEEILKDRKERTQEPRETPYTGRYVILGPDVWKLTPEPPVTERRIASFL